MTPTVCAVETDASFSASAVTRVVNQLRAPTRKQTRQLWLEQVAHRVVSARPDLAPALVEVLGVDPTAKEDLAGLTIGEIGVCYEALLASLDRGRRRRTGQFFTPDDAAAFMASHAHEFPPGTWLDPCCGVGNLSWHLAAVQEDPAAFVRDHLILIDRDEVALKTAVAIIAADFTSPGDVDAVYRLWQRSLVRDFLARKALPRFDFAILNPPYARAPIKTGYRTASTRDFFAYFLERIVGKSRGFICVTPASFLSIPKHQPLRDCLEESLNGGDVYVFDNVPDTLFRGYKFGSANTSRTNFVRAAITVASPTKTTWRTTPILRWTTGSRQRMFAHAHSLLSPRVIGPHGEWGKLPADFRQLWRRLQTVPTTVGDLLAAEETPYPLTVATTPRYFISAAFRPLQRSSKTVLHFNTEADQHRAAIVLNSSLPYLWWRVLDGGVSLPFRVLRSVPLPDFPQDRQPLINALKDSESTNLVTKLNAGKITENIKHPQSLVQRLNKVVIPESSQYLAMVYSQDMFSA